MSICEYPTRNGNIPDTGLEQAFTFSSEIVLEIFLGKGAVQALLVCRCTWTFKVRGGFLQAVAGLMWGLCCYQLLLPVAGSPFTHALIQTVEAGAKGGLEEAQFQSVPEATIGSWGSLSPLLPGSKSEGNACSMECYKNNTGNLSCSLVITELILNKVCGSELSRINPES